ncbi:hypothetical protein [Polymorphospora rubra]|uniref:Uncharacterized protein n=1 Tax=Polymorphospora rubra TaxID=338584 RepID=A0A810MXP2_9ACTN|nr:hypothetical protein [Polymorphospora rubra]BCJ65330.1 hypothetical protein Prubr_23510 [Polymorphospora rubra]
MKVSNASRRNRLSGSYAGRVALVVAGGAFALAATGCGPLTGESAAPVKSGEVIPIGSGTPAPPTTEASPVVSATPAGLPGGVPSGMPGGLPTKGTPGGGQPTQGGGHPTKPPAGTSIVYFKVVQKPTCPTGTDPGRALIVGWKTTGATAVALSADNPGMVGSYGTYHGNEGSQEFSFSCAEKGRTETHTYTIHTIGDGPQRSKTLDVSLQVPLN